MNIKPVKSPRVYLFTLAAALLFAAARGDAQSVYSNAVMALNPYAYWPLQESVPPPRYDTETNLGSLGPIANAYYYSSQTVATNLGAIVGDPDGSRNFLGSGNSGAGVPVTDHRISLFPGQPFTVECWARATGGQSFVSIVNQQGLGNNGGGLNGVNSSSGWSLCQNFLTYRGTGSANSAPVFSFHVFNNDNNFTCGADVDVTNGVASGEWLTGGASGYQNTWVYLCGVFDGTNAWLYMYSTNLTAAYSGTNGTVYQCPITSAGNQNVWTQPTLTPGLTFSPDTWDPILFGQTRSLTGNPYHGFIDEVAIYTNALTFLQISNHFNAGTNGLGNYSATIQGDGPYMYWRMDAPQYTNPPPGTFPTAMNYGSGAFTMTNLTTGAHGPNCAVYQPGTVPGLAGPSYVGFGPFTNACAFNGLVGAVDAGFNPSLNPTGTFENFTLVGWYKGNPMSAGGYYNCLASHSDRSWKAEFNNGKTYGYRGGWLTNGVLDDNAVQAIISPSASFNANDGNWHMYTLVSSAVPGGTGTNLSVYLDSGLVSVTVSTVQQTNVGNATVDAWIGGAPDFAQPTNESSFTSTEQYFGGKIAQVAFFTNALTFNQIQNLFFTAQPVPVISRQPSGGNAGLNGTFTMSVSVQGTPPYYYQWFATNSGVVAGATSPSYTINPVLASSGGGYYVVVTNIYGAVTSVVANVTVVSNLTITAQFPISYVSPMILYGGTNITGTNYLGSTPTFSVSAVGASPIIYQWLTNGVTFGSATNASLTLTNCQLSSPTNFSCIVTNVFGSLTSITWSVSYIPTATAPFPQLVLADQPIGYWRLNEGPDNGSGNVGTICDDYQSGNNGLYTNVVLDDGESSFYNNISGYSPITDPADTAALFDWFNHAQDYAGGIETNIDFATPAGNNAEFSVAVWANGASQAQNNNAGLVSKGHWGAEQFTLDEGSTTAGCLRFTIRDALTGNYYSANSSINLGNNANWHYVVGICDEANAQLLLYVDGQLVSTAALASVGAGILSVGPVETMIGARDSSTTLGGVQYNGFLNDVEIYNYVLSSNQIVALYNSAGIPVFFTQQPITSTKVDGGSTLVVAANVGGTPPLTMQWYDENASQFVPGQTSNTLVIPNITASDTYYLTASNNVQGTGYLTNSTAVQVTVFDSMPDVTTDVKNPFYALAGQTANNSATVFGALPLSYQWQFYSPTGWVNMADNGRISGSLTSALSIGSVQSSDASNYQLVITNVYGATTSSVATLIIPGVLPLGFGNGTGWAANGGASLSGGVLTMTTATSVSPADYFFQIPQYVGGFEASFTYLAQAGTSYPLADGTTFCLQDDSRGVSATGAGGGGLGYSGIAPSAALQLNIFTGNGLGGMGYSFGYNGSVGQTTYPGGVNLTNGAVDVSIFYASGQIALSLSNELSTAVFSTNIYVGNISQDLGSSTAYVGFTAAYGGDNSVQTVSNFKFVSIPPQAIQMVGNNLIITWPGMVVGPYTVQENSSINTTNWVNVTNSVPFVSGGLNQAIVPVGTNQEYYRLILPQP